MESIKDKILEEYKKGIDQSIREKLQELDGKYKFNDLLTFMEGTGINFINKGLKGPAAIATPEGILIDIRKFNQYPDMVIYFIFIHEIAHMKRLQKYGREWFINQLSISDYDEFLVELFKEEVLADRYATRIFYKLNKIVYPWYYTQQLNLFHKQKAYEPLARTYYGKIENDEKKYYELLESFIK